MRRVAVVAAAVLVLSACGSDEVPEVVAVDVSGLRVTGEQEQPEMFSAYLSTDGARLLYNDENGACVRGADGSGQQCFELVDGESQPDTGGAVWSPDGAKLAFTDALVVGAEPDVWVLDVGSGELTNLTNDGVGGWGLRGEPSDDAVIDQFPSWSADGRQIRFARRAAGATTVDLMTIRVEGGEPTRLRETDIRFTDLRTMTWSADDIAWFAGPKQGGAGVVRVQNTLGGDPVDVLRGDYPLLSFSADGQFLLADAYSRNDTPTTDKARVVPAQGGDAKPVATGPVAQPGWGPKGHALAFVASPDRLMVVGQPGGKARELYSQPVLTAAGQGMDWVPGKLLVMVGDRPVVLSVDG